MQIMGATMGDIILMEIIMDTPIRHHIITTPITLNRTATITTRTSRDMGGVAAIRAVGMGEARGIMEATAAAGMGADVEVRCGHQVKKIEISNLITRT
jgi:hypothetical protein